jgi:hypothetical protein
MRARQLAGVAAAEDPCLPVAERLTREGLLSLAEGHYHLTPRGLELADAIASDLLAAGNP